MTAGDAAHVPLPLGFTQLVTAEDGGNRLPKAGQEGASAAVTSTAVEAWERRSYWVEVSRPAREAALRVGMVGADALVTQEIPEGVSRVLMPATAAPGVVLPLLRPTSSLPAPHPDADQLTSIAEQVLPGGELPERAWRIRCGQGRDVDAEWFVVPAGDDEWVSAEPLEGDEVGVVVRPLDVRSDLLRVMTHLHGRR